MGGKMKILYITALTAFLMVGCDSAPKNDFLALMAKKPDMDPKTLECMTRVSGGYTAEQKEGLYNFFLKQAADKEAGIKPNMLEMMDGPSGESIGLIMSLGMACE